MNHEAARSRLPRIQISKVATRKIPIRRDGDQQLVGDGRVDREFGVRRQELMHGRFRVVSRGPGAVGIQLLRGIGDRVEDQAVTASLDHSRFTTLILVFWQWRIAHTSK